VLVIWRRAGESILVGDNVDVAVLEMRQHRVKLGIVAPASVTIVRKEAKLTRDENVTAALSTDRSLVENLLTHLARGPRHN
jgi:carbon storage regulator